MHTFKIGLVARVAVATTLPIMLSACFLAEGDEEDPIINDEQLAYPVEFGDGRECDVDEHGDEECKPARFKKLASGGYSVSLVRRTPAGEEYEASVDAFKFRKLVDASIPDEVYLAQKIEKNVQARFLGLLVQRNDGAWLKIEPQCEDLTVNAFVGMINHHWLQTAEDATLNELVCYIRREGLDDKRLYEILNISGATSKTVYFSDKMRTSYSPELSQGLN
jgi:hypothetical protein